MSAGVFVLGAARSGTTLLNSILLSSGLFAVYEAETLLLNVCRPRYGNLARERNSRQFLTDWFSSRQFIRSGLLPAEFRLLLDESGCSYFVLLHKFMSKIAEKQSKLYWSDSTPANVFYVNELVRYIPGCKIINIIRDGRDVALSRLALGWSRVPWPNASRLDLLACAALQWRQSVRVAENLNPEFKSRMLSVRYEDLVLDTASVLDKISTFLDVDIRNGINDGSAVGALRAGNSAYEAMFSGISTAALGRWKLSMSSLEHRVFCAAAGEELERYGYEGITPGSVDLNVRVKLEVLKRYIPLKQAVISKTVIGRYTNETLEIGQR